MNATWIYRRKIKGLDNGVWLLMIIMMVLSLGLLSFFLIDREKCIPFTFKISTGSDTVLYTGKTIYFDASISVKKMTWDFGDGTEIQEGLMNVSHKFTKEGKFTVKARISSGCTEEKEIIVKLNPDEINTVDKILGPSYTVVGKEEEFISTIYGSTSSWEIEGHPDIKPNRDGNLKVSIRFPRSGNYRVKVTLDGNRVKSYTKDITVTGGDAPKQSTVTSTQPLPRILPSQQNQPVKPPVIVEPVNKVTVTHVTTVSFKEKLIDVMKDDPQYSLEDFNSYLDYGADTKVLMNNQQMNFRKFYNTILGKHTALRIDKVEFTPDGAGKIIVVKVTIINL